MERRSDLHNPRLDEEKYLNVEGVWEALGGRREERSPDGDVEDPVGAAEPRAVIPEPQPGPLPGPGPVPEPPAPEPEPLPDPEPRPAPVPDPVPEPVPADTPASDSVPHRFGFRFALAFRAAALPFLVTPSRAAVVIETTPDGGVL
jgi:hypothetical protein